MSTARSRPKPGDVVEVTYQPDRWEQHTVLKLERHKRPDGRYGYWLVTRHVKYGESKHAWRLTGDSWRWPTT